LISRTTFNSGCWYVIAAFTSEWPTVFRSTAMLPVFNLVLDATPQVLSTSHPQITYSNFMGLVVESE